MPFQMNGNTTFYWPHSARIQVLPLTVLCPQLVPVSDEQMFFVRTDNQLTDAASVTSLLHQIADEGGYRAVFSLDFQALGATDTVRHRSPRTALPSSRRLSLTAEATVMALGLWDITALTLFPYGFLNLNPSRSGGGGVFSLP